MHIEDAGDKRFVCEDENAGDPGCEGSLQVKKTFHGHFGGTDNVIVGTKSRIQEKSQISDNSNCLNGLGVFVRCGMLRHMQ